MSSEKNVELTPVEVSKLREALIHAGQLLTNLPAEFTDKFRLDVAARCKELQASLLEKQK